MTARLVITAPGSGSGKTTLTVGLIGALRQRGLTVQPFKCGPDYIDPGYHTLAAGRACRNLDTWLLRPEAVEALFRSASTGANLAVIEGVMGLFDGVGAMDDTGSTADVARLLDASVVLVIDARGMGRSAAALVEGFRRFDPRVRIAGVLLNRVGSARHAEICATAIGEHTGLPCLGYLERRNDLRLPERHLGLITAAEPGPWQETLSVIAARVAQCCDLDALLALACTASPLPWAKDREPVSSSVMSEQGPDPSLPAPASRRQRPVIAVAQDAVFSFAYPEMGDLLRAAGATLAPFSPLTAPALPEGTAGIILSGGFPELYAEQLSRNLALQAALRSAHDAGMPIYAECGGLMYLTEELQDQAGRRWPMVGLLPGRSVMTDRLVLGYRTVRALADGPLLPANATLRGHEFHYSRWEKAGHSGDRTHLSPAYEVHARDGQTYTEGAQVGSLLASYVHLHWLARPPMAHRFVQMCRGADDGATHG